MEIFAPVVGTGFRGKAAKDLVIAMKHAYAQGEVFNNSAFTLVREPENSYDENAVLVLYGNQPIGYIAATHNKQLAPAMDEGDEVDIQLVDFDGFKPLLGLQWEASEDTD